MSTISSQDQQGLQTNTCFFEDAPVSIWVEDFSAVKRYFDSLEAVLKSSARAVQASRRSKIEHMAI